ncbi:MAG: DUF1616 domain-containing protein [Candidatus Hodarchaeota archaeon]
MSQNSSKEDLTRTLISLITSQQPRTMEELVLLAVERTSIPKQEITEHVLYLHNLGKLRFEESSEHPQMKLTSYMKTEKAHWYWAALFLSLITTIVVFVISEGAYPFVYVRYVLGAISVLCLPGYTLSRALFPKPRFRRDSDKEEFDFIERLALSVGLSLVLMPVVGLALIYTWGIRLTSVVLSLLATTITFATVAVIREHYEYSRARE